MPFTSRMHSFTSIELIAPSILENVFEEWLVLVSFRILGYEGVLISAVAVAGLEDWMHEGVAGDVGMVEHEV